MVHVGSMCSRCRVDVRSSAVWIDGALVIAAFSLAKIRELILKNSATYIEVSYLLAVNLLICWLRTMYDF